MSEPKKLKSENKMLKLQEDEYQLEMSLYDDNSIEFKVILNSPMANCYYIENYDLKTIAEISLLLLRKYKDMEAVYQYYKVRILSGREMNLVLSPDKNIMSLKYQKIVDDEEVPVELKLKKNGWKRWYCSSFDERSPTIEKIKLEDKKNEEIWKIEEEKFSSLNDNVNLTNNF